MEAAAKVVARQLDPPLWTPQAGRQTEAYFTDADELFYGGAAGGGKSDLLLGLAGTQHFNSIIFRRVFTSMRGMIERSREIYNRDQASHSKDSFNENTHLWRLTDGRLVEMASIQFDKNVNDFKGRPHDFYAFDEITEFTEYQYTFVIAWNRTTRPGQRCRIVCTGNPPTTAEGQWVVKRWGPWLDPKHPNPAKPGELRWFTTIDDKDTEVADGTPFEHNGEVLEPKSRTFIPARLADNPILEATGYRAQLQGLPEPLRSQLLYGDFNIGVDDDPWQVIPTEWVRMAFERWKQRGKPDIALSRLGVDVARGGKDKTVLAARYGNWLAPLEKHDGRETKDGPAVAALVVAALNGGTGPVNLDIIGVGSSPYDVLKSQGIDVAAINFADGTDATDRAGKLQMRNLRAAAYWKLRESLDPTLGDEVALPDDSDLLADLTAPRWKLTIQGVQIESKEDIIARIGRSPDCGDAIALAWWIPPSQKIEQSENPFY